MFAIVCALQEKDDKIASLHGVIADMRGDIVALRRALDSAQTELVSPAASDLVETSRALRDSLLGKS